MTSLINTTAIDITYPVAGQDNDTQGFRTNFGSIANNLSIAASEITTLQTTVATLGELPVATSEVFYQGTGIAGSGTFATGSRTITLAGTYGSVNNIKVHFDGVYQGITSILTLIGNVLTFVDPIPAGVGIVFVDGGIVQQVSVPPTGSVGVGQLAPDALAYFQAQINEVTPNSEVFTIGTGTGKFQIGGTSITLAGTYGTLQNIKVHFGVAYVGIDQLASLVGHVLTFSTPIPSWVTEIYVDGGTVATLGVPAVASIGVSQLAPDTITYIQSQIGINTNPTSEVFSVGTGSGKFQIGGTVITLAGTYGSLNNIRVYFDAAYQGINQLRSLVGNVLTFMSPIPTGVINIYVDGGNLTVVGIPSNGTVGLAQLAPDALNYLASTSGTAPSFTGPVTISSTNSANSLIVTDTGVNGANIKLVGNGPTTPNKFIRSQNGAFQIINSAYTTPLLTIDDVGNLTAPTSVITPTIVVNAITNTGQTYNTEPTAGIEHGSTTIAGTPFIDFHSSGLANDYDSRLIANGGTTNGTGNLGFAGAQFAVNGLTTPLLVNSTNSSNIKLAFQEAGVNQGFIGAAPTMSFYAINKTNTSYTFNVDQSGNGTFQGSVTAGTNIYASGALTVGGTFNSGNLAELGSAVTAIAPSATNIPLTASTYMGGAGGNGLFVGQYPTSNMAWIQSSFTSPTTATYHISMQPLGGYVGIGTGSVAPVSALQVNGIVTSGGITNTGQTYNISATAGIEHGSTTTVGTPFIDFHSSGTANDYDCRIIANGGTTNGTGTLSYLGSQFAINGLTTPLLVNSTSSSNIKLAFQEAGVNQGFIGAAPSMSFYAINKTNTSYTFNVDQSGNGTFGGVVTAYHLSGNNAYTPTIAANAGAGTSPTIAIVGNDIGFKITLTTGTSPSASSAICTITFTSAYVTVPYATFSPSNAAAATAIASVYDTTSTSQFVLNSVSALAASTQYIWQVHVSQ